MVSDHFRDFGVVDFSSFVIYPRGSTVFRVL